MNVGYVLNLRKAMGVVEIVALNKEGVKTVFHLHNAQYKIDTASVYKGSCFQARSNQPFWKKNKGHLNGVFEAKAEPRKQLMSFS